MEWVETTGKTIDEAIDLALDQLGIDRDEADVEILEEPKVGLFGRVKTPARVRARVAPRQQRAKIEHRDRRRSGKGAGPKSAGNDAPSAGVATSDATPSALRPPKKPKPDQPAVKQSQPKKSVAREVAAPVQEDAVTESEISLADQGVIVEGFLSGLTSTFGLEGSVATTVDGDEYVDVAVVGNDLGLLLGPKGRTLDAVQELARTVVQRQAPGIRHSRIRVDVGGYRQRRREALARFTQQVAEQVTTTGNAVALEPMSAPDRKVDHDTVAAIESVQSTSEGEEPRRRVVISPATAE